jgi:hypothetical protein
LSTENECVALLEQRDLLIETVCRLTHLELIGRDSELGLRNTIAELRLNQVHIRDRVIEEFRSSSTWKVGLVLTWPIRVFSSKLRSSRPGA